MNTKVKIIIIALFWLVLGARPTLAANTGQFSAEVWVNPTTSAASKAILGKAEEVRIFTDASGYAGCQIMVSSVWQTAATATTNALALNTWSHIACSYDKANLKIYVNGVQMASQALTSAPDDTAAAWKLGQDDSSGTTYTNFIGVIDDYNFYDYSRTAKQIVSDMNAGHPAVGSPVGSAVGYWKFDEGYGTTANNSGSQNSQTSPNSPISGTLSGFASPATSSSGWTQAGRSGRGLIFDGTDDVVTVTNATAIDLNDNLANGFTVSAWVNADGAGEGSGGQIFQKGTNTYLRVDSLSGSNLDVESKVDLATTDGSVNVTGGITTSSWNHIAFTFDGSTTSKIYINGLERGSHTAGSGDEAADANNLLVGGTTTDNFDGYIDDFKIYSYPLTSDEVKTEYNRGSSLVLGSLGTDPSNPLTPLNSSNALYCPPGNTEGNCASGQAPAPVAEWNFDEGTGTTANDTSGNANTGTWDGTGATHWTQGKYGKAGNFNGSDDYVNVTDSTSLSITGNFTLSAWVKIPSLPTATANYPIISKRDSGNRNGYALYYAKSATPGFAVSSCSSSTCQTSTLYNEAALANTWTHVAGTYDGSYFRVYVNGALKDQTAASTNSGDGAGSLRLGYSVGNSLQNYWNVLFDQVRIYNYARTAAQIAWDYNRGGPVAHFKFDECQGSTVNSSKSPLDSSSSPLTGTLTIGSGGTQTSAGTCSSGTSTEAWSNGSTGKFNSSLNFDGTDDYTQVTDTANLRFDESTKDFSLFAWVKRTTTGAEYIISKEDADNDGYRLMFNSSNQVLCSEDATDVTSTSTITDTNWHLVGCTIDRDGNGQTYIDGRADGAAVAMGTDAMATTSNIRLATRSYTSTNYLNGQIDDVRIYNYALTPTQIKTLYNENSAVRFGPSSGSP